MKKEELQIGDYVLIDGSIRKVSSLSKCKIGYYKEENKNSMQYARYCDVKPIEVSEEMLLKIGFKKDKDIFTREPRYNYPHKYKEPYLSYSIKDNNTIYATDRCMNIHVKVVLLHEIQHFIRFCKLEEPLED